MGMRGTDQQQNHVFSYISPEQRVRKDHPLRPIRTMVDEVLKQLSPQFHKMYAKVGRPSIPPEQLLRAQLLQMLYSVRSERLLMEEMDYNILFRWFVGLNLDDAVWDATVFHAKGHSKLTNNANQDRDCLLNSLFQQPARALKMCAETDAFQPWERSRFGKRSSSSQVIPPLQKIGNDKDRLSQDGDNDRLVSSSPSPMNAVQPALKIYFLKMITGTVCA
jgi:transposase